MVNNRTSWWYKQCAHSGRKPKPSFFNAAPFTVQCFGLGALCGSANGVRKQAVPRGRGGLGTDGRNLPRRVRSPSAFPNFSPLIRCAFVELLRGARERWWLGEARFCIDFRRYTAVSSDCQSRSCADSRTRSALRDPWGRNTGLSRHSPRTESAPLLPRRHSGSRRTPA